jgi:hypothetical protein
MLFCMSRRHDGQILPKLFLHELIKVIYTKRRQSSPKSPYRGRGMLTGMEMTEYNDIDGR